MRNFQDTFETHKQSCINAFSICMSVPLSDEFFLQMKYFNISQAGYPFFLMKERKMKTISFFLFQYPTKLFCTSLIYFLMFKGTLTKSPSSYISENRAFLYFLKKSFSYISGNETF